MYQSLICRVGGFDGRRDQAGRFPAPLDAKLLQRASNTLVDGVRTDVQTDRDLLAAQMLVDQQQAFELAGAEARDRGGGIMVDSAPSQLPRAWLTQIARPSEQGWRQHTPWALHLSKPKREAAQIPMDYVG